jgi:hypothetical protein
MTTFSGSYFLFTNKAWKMFKLAVLFPVVQTDRSCHVTVAPDSIHLSPTSSACGTVSQPWLLEAPQGQRIDVSFLDFTVNSSTNNDDERLFKTTSTCIRQYALVDDKAANKKLTICADGQRRYRHVYLSKSKQLTVVMTVSTDELPAEGLGILMGFKG